MHTVEPANGGARVTLGLQFTGPLGSLWARLTRGITTRYLEYEAAGLKQRAEGGQPASCTELYKC